MISTSRRNFLALSSGAATALAGFRAAADSKVVSPTTLWKGLTPDHGLPIVPLDVAASQSAKGLVLSNLKSFQSNPTGVVVLIPSGLTLDLPWWSMAIRDNWGLKSGARIILRGAPGGPQPILKTPGAQGLLGFSSDEGSPVSIELENLAMSCGLAGPVVTAVNITNLALTDCTITGGKLGLFIPTGPTRVLVQRCSFARSGRGDGLTHNVYINYASEFTALNSTFSSARTEGHALKCYAADVLIANCTIASWQDPADPREGYNGLLPPLDLGAWATTSVTDNLFIRRGPARGYFMEYRNRQWPKGSNEFALNYGTTVADWQQVDNRDPQNPLLFRHLLANNRFVNGTLPSGEADPTIVANPGMAARNNGSGFWAGEGFEGDPPPKPAGFQPWNERAVVYTLGNRFEGVPFRQNWDSVPYQRPNDVAPFREITESPGWARRASNL